MGSFCREHKGRACTHICTQCCYNHISSQVRHVRLADKQCRRNLQKTDRCETVLSTRSFRNQFTRHVTGAPRMPSLKVRDALPTVIWFCLRMEEGGHDDRSSNNQHDPDLMPGSLSSAHGGGEGRVPHITTALCIKDGRCPHPQPWPTAVTAQTTFSRFPPLEPSSLPRFPVIHTFARKR